MTEVLYVCNSNVVGGGEIFALQLCRALRVTGIGAALALPATSPLGQLADQAGVAVRPLVMSEKLSRRNWKTHLAAARRDHLRLREMIASLSPSTCIVMQYKWEQLLGGLLRPASTVHIEHGPIPRDLVRLPPTRRRLRSVYSAARAVLAVSAPAATAVSRLMRSDPPRLDAGVDAAAIAAARAIRESRPSRNAGLTVGYCGRLSADKRVDALILAVASRDGCSLVVVGDGPDRAALEQLARSSGVEARVRFTGFLDRPMEEMAHCDVLAFPSTSAGEGRPLTVLDALALGIPIVGAHGTAALEHLAVEFPGWVALAASAEPTALRRAIDGIARHPPRLQAPAIPTWEEAAQRFIERVLGES